MPTGAEHVEADRQVIALGGFVDRPVAAVAERLGGAGEDEHLPEVGVGAATLDFLRRSRAVLVGDDEAALEALFRPRERIALPVVGGRAHDGGEFEVHLALAGIAERAKDSGFDVVGVEVLGLHQRQARSGPAILRPGVAATGEWRRLRIGLAVGAAVLAARPVGFVDVPPLLGEIRFQVRHRAYGGMDVAIDHGKPVRRRAGSLSVGG
jgi:hypothetical protein